MVLLELAPGADSQRVLDAARAAGAVEHFSSAARRLSEVFRDVTGEDASDRAQGAAPAWTRGARNERRGRRRC